MQLKNVYYGRRKPTNDLCPDVKESLKWDCGDDDGFGKSKKKTYDQVTQIVMERSPSKWKTSYKDQFRKF